MVTRYLMFLLTAKAKLHFDQITFVTPIGI